MAGIQLRGRSGELVQLDAIVKVDEGVGPRQLNHFNRIRSSTLSASLAPGFTLGEALDSLHAARAAKSCRRAPRPRWPASRASSRRAATRSTSPSCLALLVVFMVLASQFESLIHPFTVLLAVPLAVAGAIFTLKLAGSTINLYSQIGMILLIGLVTKNSILLVEYANQLKEKGLLHLRGDAGVGPDPAAADPDDLGGHDHRRGADRAGPRGRVAEPPPARLRHRRRRVLLDRCSRCSWCRWPIPCWRGSRAGCGARGPSRPTRRSRWRGMIGLLLALQVAAVDSAAAA